jgi:hypothetical protein
MKARVAVTLLLAAISTPAHAEIRLRLSQPLYEVGQPVSFRLSNESKWVITLPNAIGWWHISDSQMIVGGCTIHPTEVDMYPGYWFEDTWDQHACDKGPQVPPGFYYLGVAYHSECCPGEYHTITIRFEIGAVPIEPASWGRVKAIFRAD